MNQRAKVSQNINKTNRYSVYVCDYWNLNILRGESEYNVNNITDVSKIFFFPNISLILMTVSL